MSEYFFFDDQTYHAYSRTHYCDDSRSDVVVPSRRRVESRHGYRLPHPVSWYGLNGIKLPLNPYEKYVKDEWQPHGHVKYDCEGCYPGSFPNPTYTQDGVFYNSEGLPYWPLDGTYVRDTAKNKALQKAHSVHFSIGEDVAQRRQTFKMAKGAIDRLFGAYRSVLHGNIPGALRYLGYPRGKPPKLTDVSSTWLALRYGWLPLVSEVYEKFEKLNPLENTSAFRAYGSKKAHEKLSTSGYPFGEGVLFDYELIVKYSARCVLNYHIPDAQSLRKEQTDLKNPLLVAWELIPLSFVADWFLPISDYLEQVGLPGGLEFLSGSVTLKEESRWDRTKHFKGSCVQVSGSTRWFTGQFNIVRTIYPSEPSLSFRVKNPLSGLHLADSIALLHQLMSRKR